MNEVVRELVKSHLGRLGVNINRQIDKIAEMQNELEHERRLLRRAQEEYKVLEESLTWRFDPKTEIRDFVWEEGLDERSN
jgi:hypothetical protein